MEPMFYFKFCRRSGTIVNDITVIEAPNYEIARTIIFEVYDQYLNGGGCSYLSLEKAVEVQAEYHGINFESFMRSSYIDYYPFSEWKHWITEG